MKKTEEETRRGRGRRACCRCPLVIQFFIAATTLAFIFTTSSLYLIGTTTTTSTLTIADNKPTTTHNTHHIKKIEKPQQKILSYHESSFVYANRTYNYRYSPKLFEKIMVSKTTTTKKAATTVTTTPPTTTTIPKIVFGVCSNSLKPIRRNSIRKSWSLDNNAVMVVFVVAGRFDDDDDNNDDENNDSDSTTSTNILEKEFHQFGDLLWVNVNENYRDGLTPKTLAFVDFGGKILQQQQEHNNNIEFDYIFKTDDDVYVNATHIGYELLLTKQQQQQQQQQQNQNQDVVDYYGLYKDREAPIRDKSNELLSKWYMSREDYPDDYFPTYAPGVGYALSKKFAQCASSNINKILHKMPWEDVSVGLLAKYCNVVLTPADENWDHFSLEENSNSALDFFPYEKYKNGGQLVKILHKVKPWYFEPLYYQKSLVDAKNYISQKKKDIKNRRQNNNKNQK